MAARHTPVTFIDIGFLVREHFDDTGAEGEPDTPLIDCCRGKWLLVTSASGTEVFHVPDLVH